MRPKRFRFGEREALAEQRRQQGLASMRPKRFRFGELDMPLWRRKSRSVASMRPKRFRFGEAAWHDEKAEKAAELQ